MTAPTVSLSERLRGLWTAAEDAKAIQFNTDWVRWSALRTLAERVSQTLDGLGLGPAARVGVVLTNSPESVATLLAVLSSERCVTVFNPLQPAERLFGDIERANPPVLVGPVGVWETPGLGDLVARLGITAVTTAINSGAVETISRTDTDTGRETAPGVAVELSTSGTTGPPKRIPLTYRQLEASVGSAKGHMKPGGSQRAPFEGGVAIVTTPLVHIGGMWGALQALVDARAIVLLERFTLDGWLAVIREHRPRLGSLPPAAIRNLLSANVDPEDLSSLRALTSGTAPVPPDLVDAINDRYGLRVLAVYGATEFSGAVAGWSLPDHKEWWDRKRGSVGRAFPGVELRVVAEDGTIQPVDTSGLLEIRTVQAGARADADGWTRTSDLAHLDADGFLYIEGRADDVIIRGGFKIRPITVVEALQTHPSVAEAAVLGLPDERLGGVPAAVVELEPGADPVTEDELKSWVRSRLLPYEIPVAIRFVDELPRGVSQKVSMPDLRLLFEGDAAGR